MSERCDVLREQILALVEAYSQEAFPSRPFVAGETDVPVAGRFFDALDVRSLVDSSLDFWLTSGRFAQKFEEQFAVFAGVKHAMLTNSGSSANLLALSCLTSPELGERQLRAGSEVITVAAGFPTTVNPIVQNGLVPVFVDISVPSYNVDVGQLEAAVSDRTGAIILAHTLGNPFDIDAVMRFASAHGLWVIEDCCDALGSMWQNRKVGTFGDLATYSFYPAHHITMGEGGCVATNDHQLRKLVVSFRDWGRDCWCDTGCDNTCGKRFDRQLGDLPHGYDHKFTYSHIGYNLRVTDMQAAVGLSQLSKIESFINARRHNFRFLHEGLCDLDEFLILPSAMAGSDPSWFGFAIAVRPGAPFTRTELVRYLSERRIGTRLLFGGNLTRQPAYSTVRHRKIGELANSDFAMNSVFWVGVFPGLGEEALSYIVEQIRTFCRGGALLNAVGDMLAGMGPAFVTGATGFVGANLARKLVGLGVETHVIVRDRSDRWRLQDINSELREHTGDLRNGRCVTAVLQSVKPAVIFHCAACGSSGQSDIGDIYSTNLLGTIKLLAAADEVGVDRIINTGSFFEYGRRLIAGIDDTRPNPLVAYTASKMASTLYAEQYVRACGRPIITLRLFHVYGPFEPRSRLIHEVIASSLANRELALTAGTQTRDFVFVDEVVDAYLRAAQADVAQGTTIDIGSGKTHSVREAVDRVLSLIGGHQRVRWAEAPTRDFEITDCKADLTLAREILGWTPGVGLTEGLRRTIRWHKGRAGK